MSKDKGRIVPRRRHIKVNPHIYIPPGIDDISYKPTYDDGGGGGDSTGGTGGPMVPDKFVIVAQRLRTSPSGTEVVDIAFETNDIPGGTIEIRHAKVP